MRTIGIIAAFMAVATAHGQWEQSAKLEPRELDAGDFFGFVLELSPDRSTLAVTADGDDDEGEDNGAVYVFERDRAGQYGFSQKLVASDAGSMMYFGDGLSMTDDTIIAGTFVPVVGGPQGGAAYVFEREDGLWTERQRISPRLSSPGDRFSWPLDMWEDRAVIAASGDDDKGNDAGAAYIFERNEDGTWIEVVKLLASDGAPGDSFSEADGVAICADVVVVGAPFADTVADNDGAAYVFERIDGSWVQTGKLFDPDAENGDRFGFSVDIHEDMIAVGAPKDDIEIDEQTYVDAGSVYIFQRDGDEWALVQRLYPTDVLDDPDAATSDRFGSSVKMSESGLIVGSSGGDGAAGFTGTASVFVRDKDGAFAPQQLLFADDGEGNDAFGDFDGVALAGGVAVVAAPGHKSSAGAVYVFESDACPADYNADGNLNILDFVAFQTGWLAQDPAADCDDNAAFNILDFVCFQGLFQAGCR
jgi:hypothetical protein